MASDPSRLPRIFRSERQVTVGLKFAYVLGESVRGTPFPKDYRLPFVENSRLVLPLVLG